MAITISVLSQKGGTGKTTTVRHLVGAFRQTGLRVLAVDLDPQGNLSDYFDIDPEAEPTIGDVLSGRASASAAIVDDVIPANLSLAEAEITLAGKMGRELTLRGALAELDDRYDIIFIDCPPALGLLTVNALVAADQALLSSEAQYFALQGVEQALEVIELARDSLNPELQWLGVLSTSPTCAPFIRAKRLRRCANTSVTGYSTRPCASRLPTLNRPSGRRLFLNIVPTLVPITCSSPPSCLGDSVFTSRARRLPRWFRPRQAPRAL